jgi:hypothetical protein
MVIFAGVWPADYHDDKLGVFVNYFVANGWFEQVTIFVNPLFNIDWK